MITKVPRIHCSQLHNFLSVHKLSAFTIKVSGVQTKIFFGLFVK